MRIKILDLSTTQIHEHTGIRPYNCAEGNWSCDCNRHPLTEEYGYCGPDDDAPCTALRFIVIDAEYESGDEEDGTYTLAEFNRDYPIEVRQRVQASFGHLLKEPLL